MCKKYINQLPLARPPTRTWPTTQARALTGSQTGELSARRLALSPLNRTSQGVTTSFIAADPTGA